MEHPRRILVVDDDKKNRILLENLLESLGYEPELADRGEEALEKLNHNIDLVLLDIMMPGMDGFEVARRIRAHPEFGDIPIVMVTILSGKEDRLRAVEAGANDFIAKPVERFELKVRVASLLKMKAAQDQIKASLREKEALLNEIHHRVKNNLAAVASMLRLQARRAGDCVQDARVVEMFQETALRVSSMGLIHEQLYQAPDLSAVNARDYLGRLASRLYGSYSVVGKGISVETDIEELLIGPDTAIPLGQIVSELFSNSLKHAFEGRPRGVIRVSLRSTGRGQCRLTVADDGVGIPPDLDLEKVASLGLRLVGKFVAQIGGRLRVNTGNGTEFQINFKSGIHRDNRA